MTAVDVRPTVIPVAIHAGDDPEPETGDLICASTVAVGDFLFDYAESDDRGRYVRVTRKTRVGVRRSRVKLQTATGGITNVPQAHGLWVRRGADVLFELALSEFAGGCDE